jgi:SAM-dependent methyltransferase
MTSHVDANLEHYQKQVEKHGVGSIEALSWGSVVSQGVRFQQIRRAFYSLAGKKILDVGCGHGDLYDFLSLGFNWPKEYVGVELFPPAYHEAVKRLSRYDNVKLIQGDFLQVDVPEVDIAVLSGTLNLDYDNWFGMAVAIIEKMWRLSRKGIVFNLENGRTLAKDGKHVRRIAWLDPIDWFKWAIRRTDKVLFFSDYHDYDFTIAMLK